MQKSCHDNASVAAHRTVSNTAYHHSRGLRCWRMLARVLDSVQRTTSQARASGRRHGVKGMRLSE